MPTNAYEVIIPTPKVWHDLEIFRDAQRMPSFLHIGKKKNVIRALFTNEQDATMFRLKWV